MRKLFSSLCLSALFFLSTSLKTAEVANSPSGSIKSSIVNKPSIVILVPLYNTFTIGSCQVSVYQTIAYVFNENTYILEAVYVSNPWSIEIDCTGVPPSNYARAATDMSFSVSSGAINDVSFATTGITDLDNVYRNSTFKADYLDMIRDNIPSP